MAKAFSRWPSPKFSEIKINSELEEVTIFSFPRNKKSQYYAKLWWTHKILLCPCKFKLHSIVINWKQNRAPFSPFSRLILCFLSFLVAFLSYPPKFIDLHRTFFYLINFVSPKGLYPILLSYKNQSSPFLSLFYLFIQANLCWFRVQSSGLFLQKFRLKDIVVAPGTSPPLESFSEKQMFPENFPS